MRLVLMLVFMLTVPLVALFAQDEAYYGSELDLGTATATIAGVVAAVTLLSEAVAKFLKDKLAVTLDGWKAAVETILVSIALALVGYFGQLGMFADVYIQAKPWWVVGLAYGAGLGLVSAGAFSIGIGKLLLEFLKLRKKDQP